MSFHDSCIQEICKEWKENCEVAGSWLTRAAEIDEEVARRCFLVLYSRQTADEKKCGRSLHRNGIGLNIYDSVKAAGVYLAVIKTNVRLTSKELEIVRELVTKYRVQILETMSNQSDIGINEKRVRKLIIGSEEDIEEDEAPKSKRRLMRAVISDDEREPPIELELEPRVSARLFSTQITVCLRGALAVCRANSSAERVFEMARATNPRAFEGISDYELHFRLFDMCASRDPLPARAKRGDRVYVLHDDENTWHSARVRQWMRDGEPVVKVIYDADGAQGTITKDDIEWIYTL